MRVELSAALERQVVARVVRPAVEEIAGQIERGAAARAPEAKMWMTSHDERVRLAHAESDGQVIPDNLRFRLPKVVYVRKGRDVHGRAVNPGGGWKRVPGWDLARRPGDEDLPIEQRINCRCGLAHLPGAVARSIRAGSARVEGTRVVCEVATRFPRAAESEFGTSGDRAARFMRDALQDVARRYQRP